MTPLVLLALAQVPLPGTASVSVALSPPRACSRCHSGFDNSAYDTWSGSVMGHSARDPVFHAALAVAEGDSRGIGDFCLRCHAPEAWLEGRCIPTDASRLDENDSGVTCSFCHRNEPNPYQRNAQYIVADDSVIRGPYADAQAPHTNRYSPWISNPALCGTCHDLLNPLVHRRDLTGADTGLLFPEQTTWTEWKASAFSNLADPGYKDCIGCHMPSDRGNVAENGPERPDRSHHGIAGANTWLLEAIEFLYPKLGLAEKLALGREAIRATLREAATLELIDAPAEVSRGEVVHLTVRVTNLTGHKLPTGYPEGRSVFIAVKSATLGIDLGSLDPVTGEPDRPLAIYHTVHGQFGIGPSHHIALNDTVYVDTRIPPRGMVLTATLAPVGKTYPEVSPGILAHFDEVTLTATVPCRRDLDRVDATFSLLHQVLPKRYVDELVADSATLAPARSATLRAAFDAVPYAPEEMAVLRVSIPIAAASTCDPPDAGVIDTGIVDAAAAPDAARVDAAVVADAGSPVTMDGGCDCAVGARSTSDGAYGAIVVVFLAWAGKRRRREGLRT